MKRLLLLTICSATIAAVHAQSTQTLTYPNGKKFLEGACTYTLNPYFHTNLLSELLLNESRRNRYEDDDVTERVEDADYPPSRSERREQYAYLAGLSILCDGPVTTFYRNGAKQSELTFKSGALTGPSTTYYPDGGVAYRGAFEAGTPTGNHTRYYKDGSVFSKGRYLPFTQAELAEEWRYYSSGGESEEREKNRRNGLTEEGLRSDGEEASPTVTQRAAFRRFTNGLMQSGKKDGTFTFFRRDGKKWAEIHFKNDIRSGTWRVWNEKGTGVHTLEYGEDGRLLALKDSTGKRETLETLTTRWRSETQARYRAPVQSAGDPNAVEPGIVEAPPPPRSGASTMPDVFTYVERMPEFIGDVREYLSKNIRYPQKAKDDGIEGRVVVQFVVRADGSITDAKVIRGIGGGCDEEALRVIRAMPKWTPGMQNGKRVAVLFNLPVMFKLG